MAALALWRRGVLETSSAGACAALIAPTPWRCARRRPAAVHLRLVCTQASAPETPADAGDRFPLPWAGDGARVGRVAPKPGLSFDGLRRDRDKYVFHDMTRAMQDLLSADDGESFTALVRGRRFGKTVLGQSWLAYLRGDAALFEGTALADDVARRRKQGECEGLLAVYLSWRCPPDKMLLNVKRAFLRALQDAERLGNLRGEDTAASLFVEVENVFGEVAQARHEAVAEVAQARREAAQARREAAAEAKARREAAAEAAQARREAAAEAKARREAATEQFAALRGATVAALAALDPASSAADRLALRKELQDIKAEEDAALAALYADEAKKLAALDEDWAKKLAALDAEHHTQLRKLRGTSNEIGYASMDATWLNEEWRFSSSLFWHVQSKLESKRYRVALFCDEYDAPVHKALRVDVEAAEGLVHSVDALPPAVYPGVLDVLADFYGDCKTNNILMGIPHIFVAGTSRLAIEGFWSGANSVLDISMDVGSEALVGLTWADIERLYGAHLALLEARDGLTREALRARMESLYNGYRLVPESTVLVFNPFSIHAVMRTGKLTKHWATRGLASALFRADLAARGADKLALAEDGASLGTVAEIPYKALADPRIPKDWARTRVLEEDVQLALLTTNGYLSIAPDAELGLFGDETLLPLVVPNGEARRGLEEIGQRALVVPTGFSTEAVRELLGDDDVLGVVDLALRTRALAQWIDQRVAGSSAALEAHIRDGLAALIALRMSAGDVSVHTEAQVPRIEGTGNRAEELGVIEDTVAAWTGDAATPLPRLEASDRLGKNADLVLRYTNAQGDRRVCVVELKRARMDRRALAQQLLRYQTVPVDAGETLAFVGLAVDERQLRGPGRWRRELSLGESLVARNVEELAQMLKNR